MRRPLLPVVTALTLVLVLAGGIAAQEASPLPSPEASPNGTEAQVTAQPLPVADYWGEWALHKQASRARVQMGVVNVNMASSTRKREFFRRLVGIHGDELQWLENHRPEDCYASEYEKWRAAVEGLESIHKEAVRVAQRGGASSLKRIARQRRAATKDLDSLLSNVVDCVDSVPAALVGDPLAGKWTARPLGVAKNDFIDRSPRRLSISESGRMLLRIPRHPWCRDNGHGLVTLTFKATGETVRDAIPGFAWTTTSVHCGPKKVSGQGGSPVLLAYDEAADVLLMGSGSECYWRNRGGSPKDCKDFWRGTPAPAADGSAPVDAATPEQETLPNLVGLDAAAAAKALSEVGLVAVPKEVHSDSVPTGEVISQGLAPGTGVNAGRSIAYVVSGGPEQTGD